MTAALQSFSIWFGLLSKTPEFHAVLSYVVALLPVGVMLVLLFIFCERWVEYIRAKFFLKEGSTVVEVRLPKEMMKSPLAMETFMATLHQTGGEGSWYDKYWLGKTRPWFSLEIASIEGQIHFFIWMRKSSKTFVSTSLYAQFPGIEVHDSEDYANTVHFDAATMKAWAAELEFTKDDAYPIKSYVDYGLDKDPKEEFKIDPIAPLIELLGSIGPNQQAWVQVIVRAYKKDDHTKPGHFWKSHDKWREEAKEIVNEMMNRDEKTKALKKKDEDEKADKPILTDSDEEIINAIERNITKFGYDVGIRLMYIAKKDNFNPAIIGGMLGSWKHFNAEHLNGFKPAGEWHSKISYPWQDLGGKASAKHSQKALAMYKRRSYFYHPHKGDSMIMSSESLATIYHFPGAVVATPTLSRVPSKKGEAPANLPL